MAVNAQFIAGKWQQGAGAPLTKLAPEDQSIFMAGEQRRRGRRAGRLYCRARGVFMAGRIVH